jgi:hypothetical protein
MIEGEEQARNQPEFQRLRAEGAADERAAIVAILERYMRHLAHGHGATGLQVLDQILQEIQQRETRDRPGTS